MRTTGEEREMKKIPRNAWSNENLEEQIKLDALANERSTRTKHPRTHFTQAEI